jgi:uncharacterized protein (TIGR02145 family)
MKLLVKIILLISSTMLFSQHQYDLPLFGDGSDGDLVVADGETYYTDQVKSQGSGSIGNNYVSVSNSGIFSVGDKIIIATMIDNQGNSAVYDWTFLPETNLTGNNETRVIDFIISNNIYFSDPLIYDYTSQSQIIRLPEFNNLTINGTLTCSAWDGSTGGVVAFSVSNELILNGTIDASGKGFRGGSENISGGYPGEGLYGLANEDSNSNRANGGGGGYSNQQGNGNGGAGGGHKNDGIEGCCGGGGSGPEIWPGIAVFIENWQNRLLFGGAGGGGQGGDGGNGGGIILILANEIDNVNSTILVSGSNGIDDSVGQNCSVTGAGGGGAGGSIRVVASLITNNLGNNVNGGSGGDAIGCPGDGGNGSVGGIQYDLPEGEEDPGGADYVGLLGCTDPLAYNYDPDAELDMGNCHYPATWYVDPSGTDSDGSGSPELPFQTIQYALDQAQNADTLYVSAGTYDENIRLIDKSVSIIGEEDEEIIIDAGGNSLPALKIGEFAGGFYNDGQTGEYIADVIILQNLIFTNSGNEAGLSISQSNAIIEDCIFEGNIGGDYGGGMFVSNSDSVVVNNSIIRNNEGQRGAGVAYYNSDGSINNTTIEANYVLSGYSGYGVHAYSGSDLDINNSVIIRNYKNYAGNSGQGGGVNYSASSGTISNTLIAYNEAFTGSAMYFENANNINILNSTIYSDESSDGWDGVIVIANSDVNIENSVYDVYQGYDRIKIFGDNSSLQISYSFIEDGQASIVDWDSYLADGTLIWGIGNIEENEGVGGYGPQFQNPLEDNFTLKYYSRLIDAGDPSSELDPDGTVADMGAYPLYQVPGCIDPTAPNFDGNATVPDESCNFADDNLLYMTVLPTTYIGDPQIYNLEDDQWSSLEDYYGDNSLSGNVRIAYDSDQNRVFKMTGTGNMFEVVVFYPLTGIWEDGPSLEVSYSSAPHDFDIEYDPISDLLILSDYDASQFERIYTYNHSTQQFNEITQCSGYGETNGHKLNFNPFDGMTYLTKQYSNSLIHYKINIQNQSCILSAEHANNEFTGTYNDADAVVFDSKRNRFLYLKSDFHPSGVGNELTIIEFNSYNYNILEYQNFSGYEGGNYFKISSTYLPKEDKLLVLMFLGGTNSVEPTPYLYDFETDSWTIGPGIGASSNISYGYYDVASMNVNVGCMDSDACNYDNTATLDSGYCIMPEGCNDWCEGDGGGSEEIDTCGVCGGLDGDIDECGVCFGENASCSGCTDYLGLNYDMDAIVEDGTCEYYSGPVWYVATNGINDTNRGSVEYPFSSIQYAVDTAFEGDTVLVQSGTYYEDNIFVDKSMTFLSQSGSENTILGGSGNASDGLIWIYAAETTIDGFTFENAGYGVKISNGVPLVDDFNQIIRNSYFINNGEGIRCEGIMHTPDFDNNVFIDNITNGINLDESYGSISNSIFYNNEYGVWLTGGEQYETNVTSSVFYESTIYGGSQNFSYCNVFNTDQTEFQGNGIFDIIFDDPLFCDPENSDFTVSSSSPLLGAGYAGSDIAGVTIGCLVDNQGPLWYVSTDGSDETGNGTEENPFSSIQFSINVANQNGDTIYVHPGTYVENLDMPGMSIALISLEGPELTTIDGNNEGVTVQLAGNEIQGFRIINGGDSSDQWNNYRRGGIYGGLGGGNIIENCIIENNVIGIVLGGESQIKNCIIRNNINGTADLQGGIKSINGGLITIDRTLVHDNSVGIFAWLGELEVTNSTFVDNNIWVSNGPFSFVNSIMYDTSESPWFLENSFSLSNEYDNYFYYSSLHPNSNPPVSCGSCYEGEGNIFVNPDMFNPSNDGFTLNSSSPCINAGNPDLDGDGEDYTTDIDDQDPDGTRMDIGAYYYQIIYGCIDIIAINYNPNANISDDSCEYYDGPVWHVNTQGLDILGAGSENYPFGSIQHAIDSSADGDTVLVAAGTYYENINFNGKNISVIGEDQETTIIDGGGDGTVVKFENAENYSAILDGFTITNGNSNLAGGIYINAKWDGSWIATTPTLKNLRIENNFGNQSGAITADRSSFYIENSIIDNNTSSSNNAGGVLLNTDVSAEFVNVSITNNTSSHPNSNSGGIANFGTSLILKNSIIWNNSPENIYNYSSTPAITYSNIEGGWEGEGNIDANPQFTDPDNGDYTLQFTSPCIDTGNPDLDGDGDNYLIDSDDQDPDGTRLDIGALYYDQIANPIIFGCMDPGASNYNSEAIVEDGSCVNNGPVFHVSTTGNDFFGIGTEQSPFLTIQAGIDATSEGDSVSVSAGLYYENLAITKNIFLIGEDKETTIIDGNQSGSVITTNEDGLIQNFTIQNGYARQSDGHGGGGIYIYGESSALIENNIIKDNRSIPDESIAYDGGGVRIECTGNPIINNNIIMDNEAYSGGGGIFVSVCGPSTQIINNLIINNSAVPNNNGNPPGNNGGGVRLQNYAIGGGEPYYSGPYFINNTLWLNDNNGEPSDLMARGDAVVLNNILGYLSIDYTNVDINYSIIANTTSNSPLFTDPENGDFTLQWGSPAIDAGDPNSPLDSDGTRADMGAFYFHQIFGCNNPIADNYDPEVTTDDGSCEYYAGPNWHVTTNGTDGEGYGSEEFPFASIQYAIDSSIYGDSVLVAAGTYYENINFDNKSIFIVGENKETTIINGGQNGSTVTINQPQEWDAEVEINNFTITNGLNNDTGGGGVNANHTVRIINSIINSNIGGGVYIENGLTSTFENLLIEDNYNLYSGGGAYVDAVNMSNVIIRNNISEGRGGGIYFNNTLSQEVMIKNVLISNNVANIGGGVQLSRSADINFINTTIAKNTALSDQGNGFDVYDNSYLRAKNTIIKNNNLNEISVVSNSGIDFRNISLEGGYESIYTDPSTIGFVLDDILYSDPQFTDPENGDFTLQFISPCIDAGILDLDGDGENYTTDIDDQDPDGTRLDIGAFFYDQTYGCTNPAVPNYNPNSTIDDGSCSYDPQISISAESLEFTVNTDSDLEQSQSFTITNNGAATLELNIFIGDILSDVDGNIYNTVSIGEQLWMAENLNVTHYSNGESIINGTSNENWVNYANNAIGVYCNLFNDDSYSEVYGKLYNGYATTDERGLCPLDWHVPSDDDWKDLESFLGMDEVSLDFTGGDRGTNEGDKLKESGTEHWTYGQGTNEVGFTALPSTYRDAFQGEFNGEPPVGGNYTSFWTTSVQYTSGNETYSYNRSLAGTSSTINRSTSNKGEGESVRCLREDINWLSLSSNSHAIEPGANVNITISVNADGLSLGDYSDVISITSNDPENSLIELPVSMSAIFEDITPPSVSINTPTNASIGNETIVNWQANDNSGIDYHHLYFQSDSSSEFTYIDSIAGSLSYYNWMVPNIVSQTAKLSIETFDLVGLSSTDITDTTFSIIDEISPEVIVTSPTVGTIISEYENLTITWTATDNIEMSNTFRVYYSNNGDTSFVEVADSTFTIPFGVTDIAQVKIVALDIYDNEGEGLSDYFSVIDNTPPQVEIISPSSGDSLKIGSLVQLELDESDNVGITDRSLSYNDEDIYIDITLQESANPDSNETLYTFLVPNFQTDNLTIRAIVEDAIGLKDTAFVSGMDVVVEYPKLTYYPDENSFLSLETSSMDITFSTQLDTLQLDGFTLSSSVSDATYYPETNDAVNFTFNIGNLSSKDTLLVELPSTLISTFGYSFDVDGDNTSLGDESKTLTYHTEILGDFDHDTDIDFDDLTQFTSGWLSDDYSVEIGPFTGDVPHLIPALDNQFDVQDLVAFIYMWDWSTENSELSRSIVENYGLSPSIEIKDDILSVDLSYYDEDITALYLSMNTSLVKAEKIELSKEYDLSFFREIEEQNKVEWNIAQITSGHIEDSIDLLSLSTNFRESQSIEIEYEILGFDGEPTAYGIMNKEYIPIPDAYELYNAYPNPFNPTTTIYFAIPKDTEVSISVYNLQGREVVSLANDNYDAGYHRLVWNANTYGSGIYFVRMVSGEFISTQKLMLVK